MFLASIVVPVAAFSAIWAPRWLHGAVDCSGGEYNGPRRKRVPRNHMTFFQTRPWAVPSYGGVQTLKPEGPRPVNRASGLLALLRSFQVGQAPTALTRHLESCHLELQLGTCPAQLHLSWAAQNPYQDPLFGSAVLETLSHRWW